MTALQILLLLIPVAYLIGSIPFGLLVGLAKGIDVRASGSGNIGATNVGRLLGGRYFALVFVLDLLKGLVPMAAAGVVVAASTLRQTPAGHVLHLLVGFAAITGHMCSLFLKFKGGKGVATSAGVALGLFPYYTLPALVALGVWALLFWITRYVSVASIIAAVVFPAAYLLIAWVSDWHPFGEQWPLLAFALLVCVMVIWRHRANIARLRAGTENRFASRV